MVALLQLSQRTIEHVPDKRQTPPSAPTATEPIRIEAPLTLSTMFHRPAATEARALIGDAMGILVSRKPRGQTTITPTIVV
jgi:hypothetical protein